MGSPGQLARRANEGERVELPVVGDRLQIFWTDERVWFKCTVRNRAFAGASLERVVRYDVPGGRTTVTTSTTSDGDG